MTQMSHRLFFSKWFVAVSLIIVIVTPLLNPTIALASGCMGAGAGTSHG